MGSGLTGWRRAGLSSYAAWAAGLMLLGLCGCATSSTVSGFRDTSAPIGATTRFEPERLNGDWWVRAEFSNGPATLRQLRYQWDGATTFSIGAKDGALVLHDVTKGARWVARGGHSETWLLWVDADYRTAALGAPDGSMGMILDRASTGGDDRVKAATDIFQWYGYDMSKLQEARQ
jgi:apolipoprotein D and lipocalin family protein